MSTESPQGEAPLPAIHQRSMALEAWHRFLRAALDLPGARVDRASFLRSHLRPCVTDAVLEEAIRTTPARAGIPLEVIGKLADVCIHRQTIQVTAVSFAAGIPGGLAMLGTIPADIAQFYYQTIQLCQKLAYLYGWPDMGESDEVDDSTLLRMTLFVGVMFGAAGATRGLAQLSAHVGAQVVEKLPKSAIAQHAIYNLAEQIGKWIGIKITRESTARSLSKIIPLVGGVMSASISYVSMKTMARRLKEHLASVEPPGC
jgi:hypothetical protein